MVEAGGHKYIEGKESGGGSSGGGKGRGRRVTEGTQRKTPGTEHQKRVQVENLTN